MVTRRVRHRPAIGVHPHSSNCFLSDPDSSEDPRASPVIPSPTYWPALFISAHQDLRSNPATPTSMRLTGPKLVVRI
jgi:hypothetical protein